MIRSSFLSVPLGIFICFGLSSSALAEPKEDWVEHRLERMQEQLDLSDEQANQIFEIFKKNKSSMEECRSLEVFTERRDCRKAKQGSVRDQISAVLNEEQKAKFEKFAAERSSHKRGEKDQRSKHSEK